MNPYYDNETEETEADAKELAAFRLARFKAQNAAFLRPKPSSPSPVPPASPASPGPTPGSSE